MSGPLLVFGAAGQVGRELMALAAARDASAIGLTRQMSTSRDAAAVDAAVAREKPRLVVNCAAYTAVDKAESEPEAAQAANCEAAGAIARAAARHGAPVLHLSTDYVFDGSKIGAYTEDDPIAPLGVYGRTKAAGEAAGAPGRSAPRHPAHRLGLRHLRRELPEDDAAPRAERDRLRVVADQRGTPTATADIAEAILAVDAAFARGDGNERDLPFRRHRRDHVARIRRSHRRCPGKGDGQASAGRRDHHRRLSRRRRAGRRTRRWSPRCSQQAFGYRARAVAGAHH